MKTVKEEAIIQLLQARLASDMRTWDQTIEVLIDNDEIVLVGMVDNDDQKESAEMIAVNMCGIRVVTNQIHIRKIRQSI